MKKYTQKHIAKSKRNTKECSSSPHHTKSIENKTEK